MTARNRQGDLSEKPQTRCLHRVKGGPRDYGRALLRTRNTSARKCRRSAEKPTRIRSLAEGETQGSNTRPFVETLTGRGGLDRRLKTLKSTQSHVSVLEKPRTPQGVRSRKRMRRSSDRRGRGEGQEGRILPKGWDGRLPAREKLRRVLASSRRAKAETRKGEG
jgi:hypothetical protein